MIDAEYSNDLYNIHIDLNVFYILYFYCSYTCIYLYNSSVDD